MTVTDQAFIRVFDSQAGPRESAPHVSFAARGVQVAAGFDPVIVWGGATTAETAQVRSRVEERPAAAPAPAARAMPAPPAPAPPAPGKSDDSATYLPSAYRNLVDVEGQVAAPHQPPRSRRPSDPVGGESRRRPLAELVTESPPIPPLQPAFEVDAVHWPSIVTSLLDVCGSELDALADAIGLARENGEKVVVFHTADLGAGCTTLTLAVARLLVHRGRSVAVVDGDFHRPHLAKAVGLSLAHGWETTLLCGTPLSESVIRSLKDGISFVPLAATFNPDQLATEAVGRVVASAIDMLAGHYDHVLIDGGCPAAFADSDRVQGMFAAAADGRVVITRGGMPSQAHDRLLQLDGRLVGVIENGAAR